MKPYVATELSLKIAAGEYMRPPRGQLAPPLSNHTCVTQREHGLQAPVSATV